jgi:hypothetical protein
VPSPIDYLPSECLHRISGDLVGGGDRLHTETQAICPCVPPRKHLVSCSYGCRHATVASSAQALPPSQFHQFHFILIPGQRVLSPSGPSQQPDEHSLAACWLLAQPALSAACSSETSLHSCRTAERYSSLPRPESGLQQPGLWAQRRVCKEQTARPSFRYPPEQSYRL